MLGVAAVGKSGRFLTQSTPNPGGEGASVKTKKINNSKEGSSEMGKEGILGPPWLAQGDVKVGKNLVFERNKTKQRRSNERNWKRSQVCPRKEDKIVSEEERAAQTRMSRTRERKGK